MTFLKFILWPLIQIRTLLAIVCSALLLCSELFAANCPAVFPAAVTANQTTILTLPTFTGTLPLTRNSGTLTLPIGDSHYTTGNLSGSSSIRVTTGSTTRLFFNGSLTLSGNSSINASGNPEDLIIIVNGSVNISSSSNVKALIYATGNVSLSGSMTTVGAITAQGAVAQSGGTVTYDSNAVLYAAFGSLCTNYVAPAIWSVAPVCGQPTKAWVQFSTASSNQALNTASVQTASNYTVTSKTVLSSQYYSTERGALLTLNSALAGGTQVSVQTSNILDTDGRTQSPATVSLPMVYHATNAGAVGQYFKNTSLSGSADKTAVDSMINFNYDNYLTIQWILIGYFFGIPIYFPVLVTVNDGPYYYHPEFTGWNGIGDDFSIRWRTWVDIPTTGGYQFQTASDDGVRLWVEDIAGTKAIDNWTDHSETNNTTTSYSLTAGRRIPIVMEYYEKSGDGVARLSWKKQSDSSYSVIPSGNLYTCVSLPNSTILNSYSISAPDTASTCGSVDITISAKDSTGATLTSYTGTMNLTTTSGHGNWALSSGSGAFNNGASDDGAASYTFSAGDNGTVGLSFTNFHADTLKVTAADSGGSVSTQSSDIVFSDNAFSVTSNDPLNTDVIAGRNHSILIQYVRRPSGVATPCAVDTGYAGEKKLKVWRSNTANHPLDAAVPMLGEASLETEDPNSIDITFTAGEATVSLATTDVGQFAINVSDDSGDYAEDASGNPVVVSGTSSTLTVRPFGLYVTVKTTGGSANPAAGTSAGTKFVPAGTPFNISVTGVRYDMADDADSNGILDGIPYGFNDADAATTASLADNLLTSSFGNEPTPASATLTGFLKLPADGVSPTPTLVGNSNITSLSNGTATVQIRFDDVGSIEISADTTNYLGSGHSIYGKSGYVGRFYPAYFSVAESIDPSLDHGHGTCSFTYQGETVSYAVSPALTLTAKNALGATTLNYGNAYWKLPAPATTDLSASIANLPTGATASLSYNQSASVYTYSGTTDYDGTGTLNITGDTFTFTKNNLSGPTAGDIPFTPKLKITLTAASLTDTDTEGVCYQVGGTGPCSAYVIDATDNNGFGGTELRYGRLKLTNVHGSSQMAALMPAQVEYWNTVGNNQAFVPNPDENNACTGISLSTPDVDIADVQGPLQDDDITPNFGGINSGGGGVITLTVNPTLSPAAATGMVRATVTVPTALQYNFMGNGLENPSATATFGIYSGREPIFNLQEGFR